MRKKVLISSRIHPELNRHVNGIVKAMSPLAVTKSELISIALHEYIGKRSGKDYYKNTIMNVRHYYTQLAEVK